LGFRGWGLGKATIVNCAVLGLRKRFAIFKNREIQQYIQFTDDYRFEKESFRLIAVILFFWFYYEFNGNSF